MYILFPLSINIRSCLFIEIKRRNIIMYSIYLLEPQTTKRKRPVMSDDEENISDGGLESDDSDAPDRRVNGSEDEDGNISNDEGKAEPLKSKKKKRPINKGEKKQKKSLKKSKSLFMRIIYLIQRSNDILFEIS